MQKHIHFIGICGVAMSALAIAIKKAGYIVTGSDAGFFPPVSTNLKNNQIDFYPGWHPNKMGSPDLVVVGNVASSSNPEWIFVQKNKFNYVSYPELIAKFFVKKNSIVCAGTYGKTTTAALLSWILKETNYDPSYMFGGLAVDENFPSANLSNSEYSILEGDEYKTARWDNSPKFSHYSPTHLLLTAVEWDHADVYPSEESYFEAFRKLIDSVPKDGALILSERILNIKILNINNIQYSIFKIYGKNPNADYQYTDVIQTRDGINFNIKFQNTGYKIHATGYGDYLAENITGAFAMAHQIGIEPEKIISAIASFKGLKRRLEKRFDGEIKVFDDIAHSPTKAKSVLKTLKDVYKRDPSTRPSGLVGMTKRARIIAVFEPNTGNRQIESIPHYDNAFVDADEVIIPELTKIKIDSSDPQKPLDGKQLTEVIGRTHTNVKYLPNDQELIDYLIKNTNRGDVIVFLGSHGFRGMIDIFINHLK